MFTKDFSKEEITIFEHVKQYFETLPSVAIEDYENAFYDLVDQYGAQGKEYVTAKSLFSEFIELQVEKAFLQLSKSDQETIRELYESGFIDDDYYEPGRKRYLYTIEVLSIYISSRFKRWIFDTFDADYLSRDDGK